MFENLEEIEVKYEDLTRKISDPEVISNQEEWRKMMKEQLLRKILKILRKCLMILI